MRRNLLILLPLLALLLAGCGGSPAADALTLASGGESDFSIVYDFRAGAETQDAAQLLRRELERVTGAEIPLYDSLEAPSGDGSHEILVGYTDRAEGAAAAVEYTGDYAVTVQGAGVVIAAALPESLLAAVQELCDALDEYMEGDTLTLPADFSLTGRVEAGELLERLPAFSEGGYIGRTGGGSTDEMLAYRADSSGCDAYAALLERQGFTCAAVRKVDGNRYNTYTGDGLTVTVLDTPAQGCVRVLVERAGALPAAAEDYEIRCTPSVTMIGQEGHQYGMGFVYQLCDGRFIVLDGGYEDNSSGQRIYETMAALAPEGEITIAAWLITHTHNDHVGGFVTFTRQHHSDVVLERVIWNIPSPAQYEEAGQNTGYRNKLLECASEKFYPGVELVNAHPGQVFHFADGELEILYTAELMFPELLENFNDSSIVARLTLAGQSTLITGDCSDMSAKVLLELYDSALRCDVLHVAHHGYYNRAVPAELYAAAAPTYVLWPVGQESYGRTVTRNTPANQWLFDHVSPDRIHVAGTQIMTFPLPME